MGADSNPPSHVDGRQRSAGNARGADENVDRTEFTLDPHNGRLDIRGVGDVPDDGERAVVGTAGQVERGDPRSARRKQAGDRSADTARTSRDERNPAGWITHVSPHTAAASRQLRDRLDLPCVALLGRLADTAPPPPVPVWPDV